MKDEKQEVTNFKLWGFEFSGPTWFAVFVFVSICVYIVWVKTSSADKKPDVGMVERFVGSVNNEAIQIYKRETSSEIILRMRAPSDLSVTIRADVNQNSKVDANIDVFYGGVSSGQLCFTYLVDESHSHTCGSFKSVASAISEAENSHWRSITWTIPKAEISLKMSSAWLSFDSYNAKTNERFTGSFEKPFKIDFLMN